jgi:hypothetical protein
VPHSRRIQAYGSLDSTQSLEVQFRPGGITMAIGGDDGSAASLLQYADISFSRVEGFHLGAQFSAAVLPLVDARAGVAYNFSARNMSYSSVVTFFTSPARVLGLGIDGYRKSEIRPDGGVFGSLVNSLTALLLKNDYRDYYRVEGWRSFLTVSPSRMVRAELTFMNEVHSSLPVVTHYSILSLSRDYRPNLPIAEGKMRSLLFTPPLQ